MVQLWVNLPAKDKMTAPGYQGITDAMIPSVPLPGDAGRVRVIAGTFADATGPARTFSPMNVWDVRLNAGKRVELPQAQGWSVQVVVLAGTVLVNDTVLRAKQAATLATDGTDVVIEANADAKLLLLAGEPLDEPVVGYGPFVMNSEAEIRQAIADFNNGRFGSMQ
jgi:redox-sensitive bicupin YhaK (pirin superfamily)